MSALDLTDAEVALMLRKHLRTIQRWCASGRLPGAYKAGRSWRIPAVAVEEIAGRKVERLRSGLETAADACERLRAEVNAAAHAYRSLGRVPRARDWRAVVADLERIEAALAGVHREVAHYSE